MVTNLSLPQQEDAMSALNAVQEKYDKQSLELQEAKRISEHFKAQLEEMKAMVRLQET